MEFSINIFTLNCWGIPIVAKNRKERLEGLVLYLNESAHEVVCLQEIWSETDFIYLRDNLSNVFPYSHYFYSGVLGSGLCIFSRWCIEDVFFHQWPLNGYIHKVQHGDWFGGKGMGLCRLRVNDKLVNVYCTHLHAEYSSDDIYLAHRVLQALGAAELAALSRAPADLAVLAGDLNAAPPDLSYRILTQLPGFIDPYDLEYENSDPMIRKASGTSDNINNSYSDPKQTEKLPEGKRIDHILFFTKPTWQAQVVNFGNPLNDRVPGHAFSYSDHNAVSLELKLTPAKPNTASTSTKNLLASNEIVCEAIKVCEEAQVTITKSKKLYLTSGGLIFMFLLGTVGFWPNSLIFDFMKIALTALCLYAVVMGTLWNCIEGNSLKAGLSALKNINRSQKESKKFSLD